MAIVKLLYWITLQRTSRINLYSLLRMVSANKIPLNLLPLDEAPQHEILLQILFDLGSFSLVEFDAGDAQNRVALVLRHVQQLWVLATHPELGVFIPEDLGQ